MHWNIDYIPSYAGALFFAAYFGILFAIHSVIVARHKTWWMIPLLIATFGLPLHSFSYLFTRAYS
jgi:hypothetical protein